MLKQKVNACDFDLLFRRKFPSICRIAYLLLTLYIGVFISIKDGFSFHSLHLTAHFFLVMFVPVEFSIFIFKWGLRVNRDNKL